MQKTQSPVESCDWDSGEARCYFCGKVRRRENMRTQRLFGGTTRVSVCNDKYINDCN